MQAQDKDDGGISDRPGNMPDIFHSFFGISGLLLLKYFEGKEEWKMMVPIDPTYALPRPLVDSLQLPAQTLPDLAV